MQRLNNKGTLFRTCVDETQFCNRKPLCGNGNDLKWCKDVWELPSPNFTNIEDKRRDKVHSKCTKGNQPENFVPNGQDIVADNKGDGLFYNCFNRADEDPFRKVAYNQSWSDLVRTPCPLGHSYRRCLGRNPSQCVGTDGGYILVDS